MNESTGLVRIVVVFLGIITLAVVVGSFVLAYNGTDIPAALIGIGGTALGGLAGILTNTGAVTAGGSSSSATAEVAAAAAAPPPPDFTPLRELLGGAASQLLEVAKALEDPSSSAPAPAAEEHAP